jgi:hypothetical protein
MFDYVRQWSLSTTIRFLLLLNLQCLIVVDVVCIHSTWLDERPSLKAIFQLRQAHQTRKHLRIIYFREFDMNINDTRFKFDMENLTASYGIDFQLKILDQSKSLLLTRVCSIIDYDVRDTILIADLYTKEIDLLSRSLKLPTIAISNRYQLVQGKLVRDQSMNSCSTFVRSFVLI